MPKLTIRIEDPGCAGEYVFRSPDLVDLDALGVLGMVPIATAQAEAGDALDAEQREQQLHRGARFLEFGERLICRCSRTPKIVPEDKLDGSPGAVSVKDLCVATRQRITEALMEAADYGAVREAASETGRASTEPVEA